MKSIAARTKKILRARNPSILLCLLLLSLCMPFLVAIRAYGQVTQCNGATNQIVFDTNFTNSTITAGIPFSITIYICNSQGQVNTAFNGTVNFVDGTNTMSPNITSSVSAGTWSGIVTITKAAYPDTITAFSGSLNGISRAFNVNPGNQEFLSLLSGSAQTGQVGTQLGGALTVKAIDQFGNPIPNIGVNFAIPGYPPNSSGQALSTYSTITNSSGIGSTLITLGSKIGTYTANAYIGGGKNISSGVVFYENATSGSLKTLSITPLNAFLPEGGVIPFQAIGYDVYRNIVNISPPSWSVVNGGGTIDAYGDFTAGTTPGVYDDTVEASIGNIGAVATVAVINSSTGNGASGSSGGSSGSSGSSGPTPTPTPSSLPVPSNLLTGTPLPSNLVTQTPIPPPSQPLSTLVIDHVTINPNPVTLPASGSVIVNAQAYDASDKPISDTQVTWQLSAGAGKLSQNYGSSTSIQAGTTPGNATIIAVATDQSGSKSVQAQVIIEAVPTQQKLLNANIGGGHLTIKSIPSPQHVGIPFVIVVMAEDNNNNILGSFNGSISIEDSTRTISPSVGDSFSSGIWTGNVTVNTPADKDIITAHSTGLTGTSNEFKVIGKANNLLQAVANQVKNIITSATQGGTKPDSFRILASGIVAGLGLLGASTSIGFMSAKGAEAIGRNPFARAKIQVSLIVSIIVCVGIAALSLISVIIIK